MLGNLPDDFLVIYQEDGLSAAGDGVSLPLG